MKYAKLIGIKNYSEHHNVFKEIIRQQKTETFTNKEWFCIGQILMLHLCWKIIRKSFDKIAMRVFKKLSKVGFDEWEKNTRRLNDE